MAMLEINHLQKKFGTTEVLRDVSLSVSKGDVRDRGVGRHPRRH